jgi:hypothetical protein
MFYNSSRTVLSHLRVQEELFNNVCYANSTWIWYTVEERLI